jgi:predicted N-acetyltransferase YhbS
VSVGSARCHARSHPLEVEVAATPTARDEAFRLVHDRYVERGYCHPAPDGRRTSFHHALHTTRVFVARAGGHVLGTLTLIPDALCAPPMAELYRDELAGLGIARGRLAEVSALAVAPGLGGRGIDVLISLVRRLVAYATRVAAVDALCIAVHPRHAAFYERLGFRRIGAAKAYGAVNDAPAVALALDLRGASRDVAAFLASDGGSLHVRGTGSRSFRGTRAERRTAAVAHAAV